MTQNTTGDPELRLCPDLWDEAAPSRRREAWFASALIHLSLLFLFATQPQIFFGPVEKRRPPRTASATLLYAPPRELTQRAPNRAPPSKLFMGAPERPRPPKLVVPKALPSAPPPPAAPKPDLAAIAKPPQLVPKPEPAGQTLLAQAIPPPQAPAPAPKLTLEDPHAPGGRTGGLQPGVLLPQRPGGVVEGAVRDLSRNPGLGTTIVGDGAGGGLPDGSLRPSPGNIGSNIELLSDPQGVDFKPYLTRILAAVRRNWYAVIPESARLGMVRGRTVIQFIIINSGGVSKLVIAGPSGVEALDRAAVAGISASNPFPPLPSEFRGDHIRLQFTFLYNIPIR